MLDYAATCNHIHLLVLDNGDRQCISNSLQLSQGRTGQEHNLRKNRRGAFWEDRYHATAVQTGHHLLQCIVYIDLNMVRTGVVQHPGEWLHGGYRELQGMKERNRIIDTHELSRLLGMNDENELRRAHGELVESALRQGGLRRIDYWTSSIAVGDPGFVHRIHAQLLERAEGRRVEDHGDICALQEPSAPYPSGSLQPESFIAGDNQYLWGAAVNS